MYWHIHLEYVDSETAKKIDRNFYYEAEENLGRKECGPAEKKKILDFLSKKKLLLPKPGK